MSVLQRLACTQSGAASSNGKIRTGSVHHGKVVSEQIMEIALRVKAVRPFAVESMVSMLIDGGKLILGQAKDTVAEVSVRKNSVLRPVIVDIMREGTEGCFVGMRRVFRDSAVDHA